MAVALTVRQLNNLEELLRMSGQVRGAAGSGMIGIAGAGAGGVAGGGLGYLASKILTERQPTRTEEMKQSAKHSALGSLLGALGGGLLADASQAALTSEAIQGDRTVGETMRALKDNAFLIE